MTSFAQNGLLLDVQHVTMRFGGITAVNDLSMRIPTGSITGLIGPNGAGKTTAFNVISGFYNPQEGDILFKGHSVKGFPPHRICRAGMARTFQNIRLFGSETALENVMVGCQVRRKSQWWMPVFQPAQRTARGRGNPREGEGPHPPPRARFLHERKGVEPALRSAAAP